MLMDEHILYINIIAKLINFCKYGVKLLLVEPDCHFNFKNS